MNKRLKKKLEKRFSDVKDLVVFCNPESLYRIMNYKKLRLVNEIDAEEANSHTLIKICVYKKFYYKNELFVITSPTINVPTRHFYLIDCMKKNLNTPGYLGLSFGESAMRKELIEQALSGTSIHDRIFPNTNKKEE